MGRGLHPVPDRDRYLLDHQRYSVSRQAVSTRAKEKGWARDLAADVDLATGDKLTRLTSAASPAGGGDIALARRGFIAAESSLLP